MSSSEENHARTAETSLADASGGCPPPVDAGARVSTSEAIAEAARVAGAESTSPRAGAAGASPLAPPQLPADDFAALEAILDDMGDGAGLEPDSPEFVRLRELGRRIEAAYGAGRPRDDDPGRACQPDPARSDSPLARAEERFRRRQEDLSRQIDERFGLNVERPEPGDSS